MGFRDPRVLSEKLDNNSTNHLAPAPEATQSPDSDMTGSADGNYRAGYVPDNATNRLSAPPSVDEEYYQDAVAVVYPTNGPNTNVTRGPNEKDPAIGMAKGWNK